MTLDLNIAGGTSDMGFQVWTAVRLGISSLNSCQTSDARAHESKIQNPRFSWKKSWIQMGLLDKRFSSRRNWSKTKRQSMNFRQSDKNMI